LIASGASHTPADREGVLHSINGALKRREFLGLHGAILVLSPTDAREMHEHRAHRDPGPFRIHRMNRLMFQAHFSLFMQPIAVGY
jgi:hypothetical protein